RAQMLALPRSAGRRQPARALEEVMNVSARLVQGAVLALAITANAIPLTTPSLAATVAVPPLVVTQLQHQVETLFTRDFIVIPGSGYTNSGFTATISTGD